MITVSDVVDKMDGWNNLRIVKSFWNEQGNPVSETVFTDERGYESIPDELLDVELSEIKAENNTLVLTFEEE